jgi:signal transduction histidine kinase
MFVHDMKNLLGIIIGFSTLVLDDMAPEDPRRADLDEIRSAGEGALALVEKWSQADRGSSGSAAPAAPAAPAGHDPK